MHPIVAILSELYGQVWRQIPNIHVLEEVSTKNPHLEISTNKYNTMKSICDHSMSGTDEAVSIEAHPMIT